MNYLDEMEKKIGDRSLYVAKSLVNDGDSVKVTNVIDIKLVLNKVGYQGQVKDMVVFTVEVETSSGVMTKTWDRSTAIVSELKEHEIDKGSSFTITRRGKAGDTKTKYEFSNVINKVKSNPTEQVAEPELGEQSVDPSEETCPPEMNMPDFD